MNKTISASVLRLLVDDYWRRAAHDDRGLTPDEKASMSAAERGQYTRCTEAYGGEPSTRQWQKWRQETRRPQ